MAASAWTAECDGFTNLTYKPPLLAARNAWFTSRGKVANTTTDTQYNAALTAVDAIMAALGAGTYSVALQGFDAGTTLPSSYIMVNVQRR